VGTYRAFWEHRSVRYRGARLIFSIQAYPDNNIVRTWRRTPNKDFEDVARDKCELREVLGDNAETNPPEESRILHTLRVKTCNSATNTSRIVLVVDDEVAVRCCVLLHRLWRREDARLHITHHCRRGVLEAQEGTGTRVLDVFAGWWRNGFGPGEPRGTNWCISMGG
jgi:hypothetical protein